MDRIISFRPDTAANWASNNPILSQGEGAIETDTNRWKIGDGSNAYANLDYLTNTKSDTAANLATNNPILSIGQKGIETDTGNIKIGDGTTAWNSLDYSVGPVSNVTVTASATVGNEYATNVNAATATITLPSDLSIGTRKLIRKINSGAGTITIDASGSETFTRAGLASVTLTSDGDFWELEKVSATRWELIDGVEIKIWDGVESITTGTSKQYADGSCQLVGKTNSNWTDGTSISIYLINGEALFSQIDSYNMSPIDNGGNDSHEFYNNSGSGLNSDSNTSLRIRTYGYSGSTNSCDVGFSAFGRWYA